MMQTQTGRSPYTPGVVRASGLPFIGFVSVPLYRRAGRFWTPEAHRHRRLKGRPEACTTPGRSGAAGPAWALVPSARR